MVAYLFEDNDNSPIARLFKKSYSEIPIYYSKGKDRLFSYAIKLLKEYNYIIIYLDCVPNNPSIIDTYIDLRNLSIKNEYRIVVIPLVCAEYYYVCSLDKSLIKLNNIKEFINKEDFTKSPLMTGRDIAKYSTFEKYSKLVCDVALRGCCRIPRKHTSKYIQYIDEDCYCSRSYNTCVEKSSSDKSLSMVKEYPLVPIIKDERLTLIRYSWTTIWDIHRKLVDEFNSWVKEYTKLGLCDDEYKNTLDYIK